MMRNRRRAEARYRLALSTAIAANADHMARALLATDRESLSYKLAEFLLEEAHWSVEDFFLDYVSGALNG